MDEKILIYIVIGIIYFLFNRLKKKNPEEQEVDRPADEAPDTNRPRPVTFEELLREITEGKQPTQVDQPPVFEPKPQYRQPEPEPAYVDYDDNIEPEEKSLETVTFDQERTNEIYENAKRMAFNRPSLEESLKLADVNTSYGKFKEFEVKTERNLLLEYTKDLRDPKAFKKAFILSEVLNRRHF
jgi:hypothetical protein